MHYKDLLINETGSLTAAMKALDKTAMKVLFVVHDDGRLMAAVSDGDIRRWILANGNFNAAVRDVANYNPVFLYEQERHRANSYMKQKSVEVLPIVDKGKRIVSVMTWNNRELAANNSPLGLPVVIMAGGLGRRLYPYTRILPKPLIPIGELPIIEHIINRFHSAGCCDFFLVVNHKKSMIKAYFSEIERSYNVHFIEEERPLGTGGGLSLLKGKIDKSFFLTNCDILIEEDYRSIYEMHLKEKYCITMVCSLKTFNIPYGVVEMSDGEISEIREKPRMTFFANTGCYIAEPSVLASVPENTAIGFTEIIASCKLAGDRVGVYPIAEESWLDMGQPEEMEEMQRRLLVE